MIVKQNKGWQLVYTGGQYFIFTPSGVSVAFGNNLSMAYLFFKNI